MQTVGLVLILINILAIAGPAAAVAAVYYNDPVEMIIPSKVEEAITSAIRTDENIEMPQYIGSTYDTTSRTVTATFSFKNPFEFDLTVNTVSADVECVTHSFSLGHAQLSNPVTIDAGTTATITVVFAWTQTAENHFLAEHSNEENSSINLVNLGLDVSGIEVETPEKISLTVPLTQ
jgi:LEA14-like dessication related protein